MRIPTEIEKIHVGSNAVRKEKLDSDTKLSNFIWIFYSIQVLNAVIKIVFSIDDKLWFIFSNGFMIIIMFYLLKVIKIILKRNLKTLVFAELLVSILFVMSLLMGNAESEILVNFFFWTICVNIPLGISYLSIEQKDIFLRQSIKYTIFILSLGVIGFLFMGEQHIYIMSLAYFMLLPITMLINRIFQNFSVKYFLLVILSIFLILLYGARGPILGIGYILAVCFYKSLKKLTYKTALFTTFTLVTLIIITAFWNRIILWLYGYLNNLGIFSRTLYLLAQGRITGFTGRDELFRFYIDLIQDKPIIGWGIAGGWIARGGGPHNAILEIILSFGIIVGGFLSILLMISFVLPFLNKRILFNDIYTAYAAVNFPLLISSGDIWVKYNFFIYIFVILGLILTNKKRPEYQKYLRKEIHS